MTADNIHLTSIEQRLKYFEGIIIAHRHLINTFNTVQAILEDPESSLLVGIVGASGSGTSLLKLLLEQHFLQQWYQFPYPNPGLLPVASIDARALGVRFDLIDYRIQLLVALQEPLINYKIEPGDEKRRRRPTDKALEHALIQSLQHRKPTAILIDNAQHFLAGGYHHSEIDAKLVVRTNERIPQEEHIRKEIEKDRHLIKEEFLYFFDIAKAIRNTAALTRVRHVLFGSYKNIDLLDIDKQLGNSNICIHMPRYVLTKQQDAETFLDIVMTFQKYIPLDKEPDFVNHVEELYAGCLGCIGFLKKQLYRTLAAALDQGLRTITIDLLRKYGEDPMTLARLGMDIVEGEKSIHRYNNTANGIRVKKSPKSKPFNRNPRRDKVG